jgi:uncharacterized membrane protein HdeD (DUF308 family)
MTSNTDIVGNADSRLRWEPLRRDVRKLTRWSIVLSILMMMAGVFAIVVPVIAGVTVVAIVGWLLVFSGLLHVAFAWKAHRATGVLWEILLGIVYGSIGIYLLRHPVASLGSLTLAIAIYLLLKGLLEFALAFQLGRASGRGWLLADGIITWLIAVMIWSTWPWSAHWVVGTLVGINMLFGGITRLILSMAIRREVA